MADHGKEFTEIDSGNGSNPESVWQEQIMRIYFQNVNGLQLDNDGADMIDLFMQMENIRADIFAFAETKLATDQPFVNQLLQRNKRKIWDHARLTTIVPVKSSWKDITNLEALSPAPLTALSDGSVATSQIPTAAGAASN
jgi:hypothetical protein